jgi:hypothetical protein
MAKAAPTLTPSGETRSGLRRALTCLAAIPLASAFVSLFLLLGTPRFDTNDDVVMRLIASGFFGAPSEHLVFSHVLLGKVLRLLFECWPALPWYELQLLTAYAVSLTALIYALAPHLRREPGLAVASLGLLVFIGSHTLLRISFTSIALLTSFSGLLLFLSAGDREDRSLRAIAGGLLVCWGALIRSEAMLAAVAVAAPAAALFARALGWRAWGLFAIAVGLPLAFATTFHLATYDSPEWRAYFEYDRARGQLHGTPRLAWDRGTTARLGKIGWSVDEFDLFKSWVLIDDSVYSSQKLDALLEMTEHLAYRPDAESAMLRLRAPLSTYRRLLTALLVLGLCVALSPSRRGLATSALIALWGLALVVWLAITARAPPRVVLPLAQASLLLVVLNQAAGSRRARPPRGNATRALGLVLSLLFLLWAGNLARTRIEFSADAALGQRNLVKSLDLLRGVDRDGIFVTAGGALGLERLLPFSDPNILKRVAIVPLGWHSGSPVFRDAVEDLGLADLSRAIVDDPRVYLVMDEGLAPTLRRYYARRHGKRVRTTAVASFRAGGWKEVLRVERMAGDRD